MVIFGTLLLLSCVSSLYPGGVDRSIMGFLGLFWALTGFMILLWLSERLYYYKKQLKHEKRDHLPAKLLETMERQKVYNAGVKALKSFNALNLCILCCGALYLIWAIWTCYNPQEDAAMQDLESTIISLFSLSEDNSAKSSIHFFAYGDVIMMNVMPIFIIGIIFWLAQLFVYSTQAGENLLIPALSIFALLFSLLVSTGAFIWDPIFPVMQWVGYGWGRAEILQGMQQIPADALSGISYRIYDTGVPGALLFYLPGVCVFMALLLQCLTRSGNHKRAYAGLAVLAVLLISDLFMRPDPRMFGLWMSGWAALGILSVHTRHGVRKIYRIYQ